MDGMRALLLSNMGAQLSLAIHLLNTFPLVIHVRRVQLLDSEIVNTLRRALTVELEHINWLVRGESSLPISLHHHLSDSILSYK